jgi:uncharacterized membrane protein affecting hemolysin expression
MSSTLASDNTKTRCEHATSLLTKSRGVVRGLIAGTYSDWSTFLKTRADVSVKDVLAISYARRLKADDEFPLSLQAGSYGFLRMTVDCWPTWVPPSNDEGDKRKFVLEYRVWIRLEDEPVAEKWFELWK